MNARELHERVRLDSKSFLISGLRFDLVVNRCSGFRRMA